MEMSEAIYTVLIETYMKVRETFKPKTDIYNKLIMYMTL